jgi:hypothetical protein
MEAFHSGGTAIILGDGHPQLASNRVGTSSAISFAFALLFNPYAYWQHHSTCYSTAY